ncbi:Small auxin-up RNA [Dillenia turbinata]|uniref:Small auxin-up RNA n=1 Tax=Dillenia turbinata TaxID=194707 RepID=A0AAN8Z427_9MAGN
MKFPTKDGSIELISHPFTMAFSVRHLRKDGSVSSGFGDRKMGSGEKTLLNFHLHRLPHIHHHHNHYHGKKQVIRDIPKGCLAIKVGQGEQQQRFVVPVMYFNHPLFIQLLKEAEEEYGFEQKGTITIPCQVEEFRYVLGLRFVR